MVSRELICFGSDTIRVMDVLNLLCLVKGKAKELLNDRLAREGESIVNLTFIQEIENVEVEKDLKSYDAFVAFCDDELSFRLDLFEVVAGVLPTVVVGGKNLKSHSETFYKRGAYEFLSWEQFSNESIERAVQYARFRFSTESALRKQQKILTTMTRMALLGELTAGISHEINNPLTTVISSASLAIEKLKKGALDEPYQKKNLERIFTNAKRIDRILKSLRAFARDGSRDPISRVSLLESIQGAIDCCHHILKSTDVEIRYDVETFQDVEVDGRSIEIFQVMTNLLSNAIDAVDSLEEKWIKIELEKGKDRVQIRVIDSGSGLDPQVRENMLKPFFTTKDPSKGTGIGLSLSKGIVEAHGGSIEISSESKNTCIAVNLPLKHQDTRDSSYEPGSVLVVDDEEDIRELVSMAFSDRGFEVSRAKNGREALRILQTNDVDAVVSDIRMPGGNGLELQKSLESLGNKAPALFFMTAISCPEVDFPSVRETAGVFLKPFDPKELVETVRNVLASQSEVA